MVLPSTWARTLPLCFLGFLYASNSVFDWMLSAVSLSSGVWPRLPPERTLSTVAFLRPVSRAQKGLPGLGFVGTDVRALHCKSVAPVQMGKDSGNPEAASGEVGGSALRRGKMKNKLEVEGLPLEGISIGGHETCIILPSMKIAFDIGRCPQRAISQEFLFISHAHMDHIGGVAMYVATRGLYKMKPPTVIVPSCIKDTVAKLFDVYRELDGSELNHVLIGLDVGQEFKMGKGFVAKPFKTYHVIPSQGYLIYSVKQKLKPQYLGLPGTEIRDLKLSGVEITDTITTPEVAFTGDTMADFLVDEANSDVLKAKVLIMESTFVDDAVTVEHAREYGHTHLFEIVSLSERLQNKAIVLIHFSARYEEQDIQRAIQSLPQSLRDRVFPLTEGF